MVEFFAGCESLARGFKRAGNATRTFELNDSDEEDWMGDRGFIKARTSGLLLQGGAGFKTV